MQNPDRYIREIINKKETRPPRFQVRVPSITRQKARVNLGIFDCKRSARKAVADYLAGIRKPKTKFVREMPDGKYRVCMFAPGIYLVYLGNFESRDEALKFSSKAAKAINRLMDTKIQAHDDDEEKLE